MNGRLALLILVTGLFMRVWTLREPDDCASGSPENSPAIGQADAEASFANEPPAISVDLGEPAFFPEDSPTGRAAATTLAGYHRPVPLPEEITAGKYRVVDNTGHAEAIEVNVYRAGRASGSDTPRELYVKAVGNQRWYFIRISDSGGSALPTSTAEEELLPELPLSPTTEKSSCGFTNRKFDFTGYADEEPAAAAD